MTTPYYYSAFGLNLASPLPCPELLPGPSDPDVTIVYGMVPDTLPEPRKTGVCYQAAPGQLLLTVDGIARFLVQGGNQVVIERLSGCDEASLRLFLLGSVMGALLQQREVLPLHASAVQVNGGCAAFLGRSGMGKSTLAAALLRRGYPLHADDICAVTLGMDASPVVYPAYPQIKLWADMAEEFRLPVDTLTRVRPELNKHAWHTPESFSKAPLPLKYLYVLHPTTRPGLQLQELNGWEKFAILKAYTYRDPYLDGLDIRTPQFRISAAIANRLGISRLERPLDPVILDEMVSLLERDWMA